MLGRRLLSAARGIGGFLPLASMYVNVKDYGALGDGSHDDTTAIRAAIAATSAKGTLFFPAGDYKITDRITIDSNPIRLLGAGTEYGGSTITQATANTDALGFDIATSGYQEMASAVEHLSIIGPTGASAVTSCGIYVKSDALLDNVSVYGFQRGFMFDADSYFSRMTGCKTRNATDTGLWFNGGNNFSAFNCHFNSSDYGVYARGCLSFRLRDCVIETNTTAGVCIDGTHVDGTYQNPHAMYAVIIDGCFFEETEAGAHDLWIGPLEPVTDVVVTANYFVDMGAANAWHVYAEKADGLTLIGNTLPGSGAGGGDIKTTANTSNVVLVNQRYDTVDFNAAPATLP